MTNTNPSELFEAAVSQAVAAEVEKHFGPYKAVLDRLAASFGGGPLPSVAAPATATTSRPAVGGECAVIGCAREVKAVGFCGAHYQKFRNLKATQRLPAGWRENAKPQTISDVALPRGRPHQNGKR